MKKENIIQYNFTSDIYLGSEQFQSNIKYSYSSISNFQARYKYGNKKKQGLRLCHWNKSNSSLLKKMPEIRNIVSRYRPHLLGISEANCHKNQDTSLFSIKDYKTFLGPASNNGMIRILLYVHKDISVNLRPDLMSPDLSSIWVEAGFKHNKKILINRFYREWQKLGVADSVSIPEQLIRWETHLTSWETALGSGKEVISLGDYNVNHCNWTDCNLPKSSQTYKLKSLITALFTRILPLGVSQLVQGPTRFFPGQKSSGLDHFFTTNPEKNIKLTKVSLW